MIILFINNTQYALEILLALSFNKDAYQQLKENTCQFRLLSTSPSPAILRVIVSLLWRLEKQPEVPSKQNVTDDTYLYDGMLSFSPTDRVLANQIYEQLTKDNFRIWIDRDETFQSTMMTRSIIMHQSKYILICMSEEYKKDSYCRCEAYYAYKLQSQIIPLIVKLDYHPGGWLGDIINGTVYIDFTRLDFDLAYNTLKHEINRTHIYLKPTEISSSATITYPNTIQQWTNEHVKSFLVKNSFKCLSPVISEMNGYLLNQLFTMCKDNQISMFHTLKNEILSGTSEDINAQRFTLCIYLRFLHELQHYIL